MKNIIEKLGMVVFYAAWPFWFFYFKFSGSRSRVLVVAEGDVLLLKGWLSNGSWALHGGGSHKNEPIAASAVRELQEEVAIASAETALQPLGRRQHQDHGLSYTAEFFTLELQEKPPIRRRRIEIAEAKWVPLQEIKRYKLDNDARFALKKYRPLSQAELLPGQS